MASLIPTTLAHNSAAQIVIDKARALISLEISPGRIEKIKIPLSPGTYEHLSGQEIFQIAAFLRPRCLKSPHTARAYITALEKFLVWLKITEHEAINEWVLMDYQQALLKPSALMKQNKLVTFNPISHETCDQYLAPVRSFIQCLKDKNLLAYNMAKHVPRLGVKNKAALSNAKYFLPEQWAALNETLDAMAYTTPGERNRAERFAFFIRFSYAMALRINEQASHFHYHIAEHRGRLCLKIIGKGNRARALPLEGVDDIALEALKRYRCFLKLAPMPGNEPLPLLCALKPVSLKTRGPHRGLTIKEKPITTTVWQILFKQFLREDVMSHLYGDNAQLKHAAFAQEWAHLTPHSLRHTRITHLVEMQKDLLWVQKFAGHEKLDTTQHYFHTEF